MRNIFRFQGVARGVAYAFSAYAMFAFADAAIKGLGPRLPAVEVMLLLALPLLPMALWLKPAGVPAAAMLRTSRPALILFRSVAATASAVLGNYAFVSIPLAEVYALIFVSPVITVVLAGLILRERLGWRRVLSVCLGIGGVLVVMRPGFREVELGHVCAFVAAFCISASVLSLRVLGEKESTSSILAWFMLVSTVIGLPLLIVSGDAVVPDGREAVLLVIAGATATLAQVLAFGGARLAPASLTAPTIYSQLCWAVLLGALFFNEFPDGTTFIGLALIIGSGLLLINRPAPVS